MNPTPIPMVDLRQQYQSLKNEIQSAVNYALENTAFIMGPNVHALEDEVICPSFTFAATAEAICYVGATPVFADIDPITLNVDPACIKNAISEKTRAIIAVHLFGLTADIDEIKTIIKGKSIFLVEDCAQSFGTSYKGKKTGTLAALVFSQARTLAVMVMVA